MYQTSDMWLWRYVSERFRDSQVVTQPKTDFMRVLDLHGYTVQDAYLIALDYVERANGRVRDVTIITGKSGVIAREFRHWFETKPFIRKIEVLNGGGAFRVTLREKPSDRGG